MAYAHNAVRRMANLHAAWMVVRMNARTSSRPEIRAEVGAIDENPYKVLHRLQRELRAGKFEFQRQQGYLKRKPGKVTSRPIVVAPIGNRIVQRAILNILQTKDSRLLPTLGLIPSVLATPTSVGGVSERGVSTGVSLVREAIQSGALYYIRSDIREFFTRVPKLDVTDFVARNTNDTEFARLFELALSTELANPEELAADLRLFPLGDTGVAQGSSLSTFAGNVVLRKFDKTLNGRGITTIRYIDDFVILGGSERSVELAFRNGRISLQSLGMDAYEPSATSDKARIGRVEDGFDFLGCRIGRIRVRPSRRSCSKLLEAIRLTIQQGKRSLENFVESDSPRRAEDAYAQTLVLLDKKIRGWGDAFRFCDDRLNFDDLDRKLDILLGEFRSSLGSHLAKAVPRARRRLTGVALLRDTPPPIEDECAGSSVSSSSTVARHGKSSCRHPALDQQVKDSHHNSAPKAHR
jgi:RNA-directed DNA polymerase